MAKVKWFVRLGQSEWARHTHGRNLSDSLQLLGSVQHGAQVGALAVDGSGDYFQINGEYVAPLNKRHLARAVSAAHGREPPHHEPPRRSSALPPTVTVRRRRAQISTSQRPHPPGDD